MCTGQMTNDGMPKPERNPKSKIRMEQSPPGQGLKMDSGRSRSIFMRVWCMLGRSKSRSGGGAQLAFLVAEGINKEARKGGGAGED